MGNVSVLRGNVTSVPTTRSQILLFAVPEGLALLESV